MRLLSHTYWRGSWVRFREPMAAVEALARCRLVTVNASDGAQSRGLYWTPRAHPRPRVAVVAAHPRVDFSQHYLFPHLLRAGYACLGANLRSLNNDLSCVHEQLLLDLAAYLRWLQAEQGIERLVWLGNSGGGSLGCFYQQQAAAEPAARLTHTPAGRPVRLAAEDMHAFSAMLVLAAHTGQGAVLMETIDPAVIDEADPLRSDPALDMYDPANGFRPAPEWSRYAPDFVRRYRQAQRERVARLDAIAHAHLARQAEAERVRGGPAFAAQPEAARRAVERQVAYQPVMTVHRTLANLHYADNSLDPSPRGYGSLLSERPDLMNLQLMGFGRLQTPDAWLSTWSGLSSRANILLTGPAVRIPCAVVHAGRDLDVFPQTHSQAIFRALGSSDKQFFEFPTRLHYFEPEGDEDENQGAQDLADALLPWLQARVPS